MEQVLRRLDDFVGGGETRHLTEQRQARYQKYQKMGLLGTDFIYFFAVNNNHPNGNEVHAINSKGLIYIYNQRTRLFITIKHPRANVLYHYFKDLGLPIPNTILELGKVCDERNKRHRLNKI